MIAADYFDKFMWDEPLLEIVGSCNHDYYSCKPERRCNKYYLKHGVTWFSRDVCCGLYSFIGKMRAWPEFNT